MISDTVETRRARERLDEAADRLSQVAGDYLAKAAAIRDDPDISEARRAKLQEQNRAAAAAAQEAVERDARAALAALEEHANLMVPRDRDERLIHELRLSRAADRIQAEIDRGVDVARQVANAARTGDLVALEVLRSEANGTGLVHRVDAALAKHGGEHASRACARLLHGPLTARLEAQLARTRASVVWEAPDLAGAVRAELAAKAVNSAIAAISGPEPADDDSAA